MGCYFLLQCQCTDNAKWKDKEWVNLGEVHTSVSCTIILTAMKVLFLKNKKTNKNGDNKTLSCKNKCRELTINSCTIKMLLKTCSEDRKMISEQNLRRKKKQ